MTSEEALKQFNEQREKNKRPSFGEMCGINTAIEALSQNEVIYRNEDYSDRIKNRLRYMQAMHDGVKPKRHKGKYIADYYTCGNCGMQTRDSVGDNFCRNCGFRILWDSCRCLTKCEEIEE